MENGRLTKSFLFVLTSIVEDKRLKGTAFTNVLLKFHDNPNIDCQVIVLKVFCLIARKITNAKEGQGCCSYCRCECSSYNNC